MPRNKRLMWTPSPGKGEGWVGVIPNKHIMWIPSPGKGEGWVGVISPNKRAADGKPTSP